MAGDKGSSAGLLLLVGIGAYFLYTRSQTANGGTGGTGGGSGGGTQTLGFTNAAGQFITSIGCGGQISFRVPGQSRVWIHQTQGGAAQYDGPLDVPMPLYTLNCATDVGRFETDIWQLSPLDGVTPTTKLGHVSLTVLADVPNGGNGGTDPGSELL